MTTSGPKLERPSAEPPDSGFFARLKRLFSVGPFAWVTKSLPQPTRFRPGPHMHGLERHDVVERGAPRKPGEIEEERTRSADPPRQ